MKTDPNDPLVRTLRAARGRIRSTIFWQTSVTLALCLGLALLLVLAVQHCALGRVAIDFRWLGAALAAVFLVAALVALFRAIPLTKVAALLDRRGRTHDRFVSALAFAETANPFHALAARECRSFLTRENFAQLVPIARPAGTGALLVPAITLALLVWEARLHDQTRADFAAAAQKELAPTARQLAKLAEEIARKQEQTPDPELQKIAAALQQSVEKLRAETAGAEDAQKAALRELSNLEAMLGELQKAPAKSSAEELKALAKLLEKDAALSAAAQAMAAGNVADAAEKMAEAARSAADPVASEKTLREALQRLAEQRALSQALQQLAQQMGQNGAGSEAQGGLAKLAQMLREMGAPSAGQPSGSGSQQMLKNLLAALQEMKSGEGQQRAPTGNIAPGAGEQGRVAMQSFAQANGQPVAEAGQIPSGQPGSERDAGTTDSPFGKERADSAEKGAAAGLKGVLGAGESLSQLLPSAGDTSKAQRRYRELYEAMAPAAEDAVVQENIPLGSRFFIKRYFESIRPKE